MCYHFATLMRYHFTTLTTEKERKQVFTLLAPLLGEVPLEVFNDYIFFVKLENRDSGHG